MHRRHSHLLALMTFVVVATTTSLPTALAASSPRLAGPWYSPQELKALIAYSKASPAHKVSILAGREQTTAAWPVHDLTPRERTALDAYANATFSEKQRILAGDSVASANSTKGTGFDWGAASAGAAAMLATVLILATAASRILGLRKRQLA